MLGCLARLRAPWCCHGMAVTHTSVPMECGLPCSQTQAPAMAQQLRSVSKEQYTQQLLQLAANSAKKLMPWVGVPLLPKDINTADAKNAAAIAPCF
jgi:hypothetical protein